MNVESLNPFRTRWVFFLVFVFACFLSLGLSSRASEAAFDFECVLSSDREKYEVGQQPIFTVHIINKTSGKVYLIGSLNGSTDDRRFPKCRFEVIDSSGKPVEISLGLCGNMNVLRPEDFVAVASGQSFNPFGKGFFSPYQFFRFPVQEPGTYTVRFSYSTTSNKIQEYFGDERMTILKAVKPEIHRLFKRIAHIELKSNDLKLVFSRPND